MTRWRSGLWAGLHALLFAGSAVCAQAVTTNVNATAVNTFSPSAVTIKPSDTVQWTWTGNNHSTTSQSTPALWDTGIHSMPFTFSFTFTNQGVYPYHCSNPNHPSMTGSVTVTNRPPVVSVTNPPNNSVFTAPASFSLGATASDPDGAVSQVEFFQNGSSLGVDTTSPYGVNVAGLGAGSYTFSAVATGDANLKATNSISVTVNAANTPPSVTVTNPANGAVFSAPATFIIGATASDDGAVTNVQFLLGASVLANDTSSPYGAGVTNLGANTYTISAIASDNLGAKATNSISLSVVTPAAVVLSAPLRLSPTQFRFNYTANTGLTYVVERSVALTGFFRLNTNTAAGTNIAFTDGSATNPLNFYRVGRLPNP